MSHPSDSNVSDSDSDYDAQAEGEVGSGMQISSGDATTTLSMSLDMSSHANVNPPRALAEYAKGTHDPKIPLLFYATKVYLSSILAEIQQNEVVGHVVAHAKFVAIIGFEVTVVRQHLLGIGGKGVLLYVQN